MIVILGKDKDFSHTLAEQVVRELGEACECAEEWAELNRLTAQDIALVVTPGQAKPQGLPTLTLKVPIRLREALAEMALLLKQPNHKDRMAIAAGFTFIERTKELAHSASGKTVILTDKEAQLLKALAEAGDKGIAKDVLLKNIWGFEAGLNTHTLETHIYRLRAKFKEISGDEMIHATDSGYGLTL